MHTCEFDMELIIIKDNVPNTPQTCPAAICLGFEASASMTIHHPRKNYKNVNPLLLLSSPNKD